MTLESTTGAAPTTPAVLFTCCNSASQLAMGPPSKRRMLTWAFMPISRFLTSPAKPLVTDRMITNAATPQNYPADRHIGDD